MDSAWPATVVPSSMYSSFTLATPNPYFAGATVAVSFMLLQILFLPCGDGDRLACTAGSHFQPAPLKLAAASQVLITLSLPWGGV